MIIKNSLFLILLLSLSSGALAMESRDCSEEINNAHLRQKAQEAAQKAISERHQKRGMDEHYYYGTSIGAERREAARKKLAERIAAGENISCTIPTEEEWKKYCENEYQREFQCQLQTLCTTEEQINQNLKNSILIIVQLK
jgi:hypothetical protein